MANLSYGSSGDDVRTLQQNLNTVGNYGLDVDGGYGPKTQAAVRDFQTKNNIAVDGVAGPETNGALQARLAQGPIYSTQPVAPVTSPASVGNSSTYSQTSTTTTTGGQAAEHYDAPDPGAATPAPTGPTTPAPTVEAPPASQLGDQLQNINVPQADVPNAPDLRPELEAWLRAAQEQATGQIDYATQQGITELQRAEEDAQPQYQAMRDQISADEARALDNQALYAEARGDRGGVGQAQYGSIQNTAAQNRLQVNQAQTKLATDTARQIADLRARGEFEKADKFLELTQNYLSQLMSLEQWAAEYNLNAEQFRQSMAQWAADFSMQAAKVLEDQRQWDASYALQLAGFQQDQREFEANYGLQLANFLEGQREWAANYGLQAANFLRNQSEWDAEHAFSVTQSETKTLASAGEALLNAGIMPSDSQLKALGLTREQAQQYIAAMQLSASAGGGSYRSSGGAGAGSGGTGNGSGSGDGDGNNPPLLEPHRHDANENYRSSFEKDSAAYGSDYNAPAFNEKTGKWSWRGKEYTEAEMVQLMALFGLEPQYEEDNAGNGRGGKSGGNTRKDRDQRFY